MHDGAAADAHAPSSDPLREPLLTEERRARTLAIAAAAIGAAMFLLGVASAYRPPPELVRTAWAGYDPPFDAVSGILLILLSFRLRERSPVARMFALATPILTGAIAVLSPNVASIPCALASATFVGFLYPLRGGFVRGPFTGPQATEFAVIVTALVTLLFGTVGARWLGSQFSPPVRGWGAALYFTVSTISTNGSIYEPQTNDARGFVVVLILLGVGTFLTAIAVLFLPFVERRIARLAVRIERSEMEQLAEHVVICGTSPEALATARTLRAEGVHAVVLGSDARLLDALKEEGLGTHLGDPSLEEDLKYVGIDRARSLVVAQESDAANLLTVITARAMQPRLRIVAVAASEGNLTKLRRAGADEAVSVVSVAAQLVSAAALDASDPDKPHVHSVAHGPAPPTKSI